jgi:uncharacterized protein
MSKNSVLAVGTILALAMLTLFGLQLAGSLNTPPAAAADTSSASLAELPTLPRTITVVGRGTVASQPDVATAMVGVEVTSSSIKEATAEATTRMENIMAALKAQGILEGDIQTSNYSINYETRFPAEMPAVTQGSQTSEQPGLYHVSNMVNLKIRDLKKVGQVLDDVVNAGANSIWGVTFTIDDSSRARAEARMKAVEDARARATELAVLTNVSVGPVLEVSEIVGSLPYNNRFAVEAAYGGGAGPVTPGELEVTMEVQITFAIE